MIADETSRRDFLKTAAGSLLVVFTQEELAKAATLQAAAPVSPAVKLGVIGLGQWGKEIVSTLSPLPSAQVVAICDSYEPALKKGQEIAPKASLITDYRKLNVDGCMYGHVLDPCTGEPAREALAAAVTGPSPSDCEALSTALLVRGPSWLPAMQSGFPEYYGFIA